jgi:hypothetical protein
MKKIYLILSVFAIVFTACETDFDVNADWEETTVVFGLLDAAKDTQFIKISKAFLGEADALQMAQYSDSINFNKGELDVKITRINNNGSTDTIMLNEVRTLRDEGYFNDSIVMYTFENFEFQFNSLNQYTNFLNSNSEYELLIKNNITGNSVSSTTEIIKGFNFSSGIPTSNRLTFYVDGLGYRFPRFEWSAPENVEIFQFNLRFHYKENGLEKELSWNQTELGSNDNILILSGEDFFHQFLANNLAALADDEEREFMNIDIEMTLGTQDLKTYIAVNEPITGIVQERPQFTNINNGIGLFSSRYTKVYYGLSLNPDSEKYIIEELGLNFK